MFRALFLVLTLTSCGGAAFHMRTASGAPAAVAEGRARVVFVMPSGRAVVSILDEVGVYFGLLRGGSYFVRDVEPGVHRFYAVRNVDGYVVHTEALEAGQTYYVVADDPVLASFRLRAGGCDEHLDTRLSELSRVEPDPEVSEASIRAAIGDEPMRMHEADQRWERMNGADQAARTVARCGAPVPAPAPVEATPAADSTPGTGSEIDELLSAPTS